MTGAVVTLPNCDVAAPDEVSDRRAGGFMIGLIRLHHAWPSGKAVKCRTRRHNVYRTDTRTVVCAECGEKPDPRDPEWALGPIIAVPITSPLSWAC